MMAEGQSPSGALTGGERSGASRATRGVTVSTQVTAKKILFVDDEERVLEGLKRMLRPLRHEWQMEFLSDSYRVMRVLEEQQFDVMVTDIRMPGMDGMMLLNHLQKNHPKIVRIVLTGHTELEAALRALPVAHQFLSKPCDPATLRKVIDRACSLNELLGSEAVRNIVGGIGTLPSLPDVYGQLLDLLAQPDVSAKEVSEVIEADMALCAKILQLTNSAYIGLSRPITTLRNAVAYLGTNMIKNIVLSSEVHRWVAEEQLPRGFSPERLQRHSFLCARLIPKLVHDVPFMEDAITAAILLDIGQLVLATQLKDQFTVVLEAARVSETPLHTLETEMLGVSHAEVGAYLLGLWGLSYPVVEAVAHCHEPQRVAYPDFDVLGVVALAEQLITEACGQLGEGPLHNVDPEFVESLGMTSQLPALRALAVAEIPALSQGEGVE
ncbi:MAG: response regulator [Planctomycetota bacterium]